MRNTPWNDCQVAFGIDDDIDDDLLLPMLDQANWSEGWEFTESDGTGARTVLIFRVTGQLTHEDGKRTKLLIRRIIKQLRQQVGVSTG